MTAAYGAGPRDLGSGGGWFCEMKRLLQALVPLLFVVLLVAEQLEPRPLGLGPQAAGAHARDHDDGFILVCFSGGSP